MSNVSFLPEDYVTQTAEHRKNIVSLLLFGVVMVTVFGAFLVTNRQWTQVRHDQIRINEETEKAAADIMKMQELEGKRGQMVEKAELAMTLIEPVPRSVLLAMLVNAMPERLSLLDFNLKSEEIKKPKAKNEKEAEPKKKADAPKVAAKTKGKSDAADKDKEGDKAGPKPEPTRYLILVSMTGVAPSDLEVSRYMNALSSIAILKGVRLDSTEEKEVDGLVVRQFKISLRIDPDADIRALRETISRPTNPMSDEVKLTPPLTSATEGAGAVIENAAASVDPAAAPEEDKP
ncbi:MAG: PilN domain-containing protein [Phycisphaerae bacterium]|nr:PilN domain-containing protein [Phycisphaerae bacterium]